MTQDTFTFGHPTKGKELIGQGVSLPSLDRSQKWRVVNSCIQSMKYSANIFNFSKHLLHLALPIHPPLIIKTKQKCFILFLNTRIILSPNNNKNMFSPVQCLIYCPMHCLMIWTGCDTQHLSQKWVSWLTCQSFTLWKKLMAGESLLS